MKIKIVVFGDLPIATKVAIDLRQRANVSFEGVVIGNKRPLNADPWPDTPLLANYAQAEGIREIPLEEFQRLPARTYHLALVCRYGRLLGPAVLDCFEHGAVNFHGGLLPEIGGLYSCCHAILRGDCRAGGTLHYIDAGIDTGDIIRRAEFPVEPTDTSFDIFQKTQLALFAAYLDTIDDLLRGTAPRVPQDQLIANGHIPAYFGKGSIEGKKQVRLDDSPEVIERVVRAFDFPGREPAFALIGGRKIYLTARAFFPR